MFGWGCIPAVVTNLIYASVELQISDSQGIGRDRLFHANVYWPLQRTQEQGINEEIEREENHKNSHCKKIEVK